MEAFKIIVLAKQVPDTRNVGKDAMKADGTVNRGALPAIFNPEDLSALELALKIKDAYPKTKITVLTMGPGRAAEILREAIYRGADDGILLTDKAFAGADTLATSYALAQTIKKIENVDLIISGRQAIDGDTAQVGPQVAEKLNLPQITYTEEVKNISKKEITLKRRIEGGIEIVQSKMPCLITVNGTAPDCRPRNVRRLMKYKYATTVSERQANDEDYLANLNNRPYLDLAEWNVNHIDADAEQLGLKGSPTKVKTIENVVFVAKETKRLQATNEDIEWLMKDLIANHTIG